MPLVLITEVSGRRRNWAWIMLLAAALCFGLGFYWGPWQSGNTGASVALREVGDVLYPVGGVMFGLAVRIIRGYRRQRAR
jgi:hypothetical protein